MLEKAKQLQKTLSHLRRTIHRQPELGFEEVKTASLVSQTLHGLEIEHQTGVGITGVVARLGNGHGPIIGLRADMDALPILEANNTDYKSELPGKMHACGHDAHTSMLLGAAMLLKDEEFNGEIRLLFQPSEERQDREGKSGAVRMVDDGATDGLDALIALHVDGSLDRGQVAIRAGHMLANTDEVSAKIMGKGGHGAAPHTARDPIFMMAPILTALHGIVSRWVNPVEPAVLTIGKLAGGTVANVIPSEVQMEITLRSLSPVVREQLIQEVERALSIARALGGDYIMEVQRGYPSLYNDETVTGWMRQTAVALLGAHNVQEAPVIMAGEDFTYMLNGRRGAMMSLGTKEPDGPPKFVHHPAFDIDETAMPIGAAILAETALRFVRGEL